MSQKVRETYRLEELAAAVRANDPLPTGTIFLRPHGLLGGPDAATKCCFDVAHKTKASSCYLNSTRKVPCGV